MARRYHVFHVIESTSGYDRSGVASLIAPIQWSTSWHCLSIQKVSGMPVIRYFVANIIMVNAIIVRYYELVHEINLGWQQRTLHQHPLLKAHQTQLALFCQPS